MAEPTHLSDLDVAAELIAVWHRLGAEEDAVRRHDMANALTAVEGSASILAGDGERLGHDDRAMLAKVLASGLSRLRSFVADDPAAGSAVPLSALAERVAADVAGKMADDAGGSPGADVQVGGDLVGWGSPVEAAEALRRLFERVAADGGGTAVRFGGCRGRDSVLLTVAPVGAPDVAHGDLRPLAPGEVHGPLTIAVALVRSRGGDILRSHDPEDHRVWAVSLPAAPPPGPAEERGGYG
jgi:hypothetical protein